jgi:hypothetical protein
MIVIALFIAYLPTLHTAVKERESFVKIAQGRIGEPPASGVNLLVSHFERGTEAMLVHLYREAERWAAGVSNTHTKYPVLLHFRAPRSPLHWLSTMTGVADAAALHRALLPEDAPPETRAVIDAIELCLADLAHTAGPATDSGGDPSDYAASMVSSARARLSAVGVEPAAEGLATERFAEMRAGYGATSSQLASRVAAPVTAT